MVSLQERDIFSLSILVAGELHGKGECIADILRTRFKTLYCASNLLQGWELYKKHRPDIVLTKVSSSGVKGLELIGKIRVSDHNTPIVVVSEHHDESLLLQAVTLHLEDFIFEPLSPSKLLHSLVCCARKLQLSPEIADLTDQARYCYRSKQVIYPNRHVMLTNKEIDLFELLLERRGSIVFYSEIEDRVWGAEVMSMDALKSAVKKIRKKIPEGKILNLRGVGYHLE